MFWICNIKTPSCGSSHPNVSARRAKLFRNSRSWSLWQSNLSSSNGKIARSYTFLPYVEPRLRTSPLTLYGVNENVGISDACSGLEGGLVGNVRVCLYEVVSSCICWDISSPRSDGGRCMASRSLLFAGLFSVMFFVARRRSRFRERVWRDDILMIE